MFMNYIWHVPTQLNLEWAFFIICGMLKLIPTNGSTMIGLKFLNCIVKAVKFLDFANVHFYYYHASSYNFTCLPTYK